LFSFRNFGPGGVGRSQRFWLGLAFALYVAAFLAYSQSRAFAFDEAYHLLAAQLINAGKTPYLDFCFPQAPLNAYWNAALFRMFGQSWRVAHGFAALSTVGAVVLIAHFAFTRFPAKEWRLYAALIAAVAIGLNNLVFEYACLAQPYGICLLALTAAFRSAVAAVRRASLWFACLAGLFAGAAAGSSLLSAPAVPVLMAWISVYNRVGNRWTKLAAFGLGVAISWVPVLRLFLLGPRQTWFNLVQYHASYRRLYWPDLSHDLEVLAGWIDSGQALVLLGLALFGLIYVVRRSQWPPDFKAEVYLCAWLAAGLSAEAAVARPTFSQYFLLSAPFIGVLAAAGLYALSMRVVGLDGRPWPVLLVMTLMVLGLGKHLYGNREDNTWALYEKAAAKVEQLTPHDALLFANEPIYFLTRRIPPSGLELSYTHKLNLPPAEASLLHIRSQDDLKRWLHTANFATAYVDEEDQVDLYGLKDLYRQHVADGDLYTFWDRGTESGPGGRH
jgi:hypothetical protein